MTRFPFAKRKSPFRERGTDGSNQLPPAKSLLRTCGYVDPCRRDGLFAVAVDNCQSWLKLLNAPSQNHLQIAPSPKAVSTALAISPSISSLYHLPGDRARAC